jgi:hypothetical protein
MSILFEKYEVNKLKNKYEQDRGTGRTTKILEHAMEYLLKPRKERVSIMVVGHNQRNIELMMRKLNDMLSDITKEYLINHQMQTIHSKFAIVSFRTKDYVDTPHYNSKAYEIVVYDNSVSDGYLQELTVALEKYRETVFSLEEM